MILQKKKIKNKKMGIVYTIYNNVKIILKKWRFSFIVGILLAMNALSKVLFFLIYIFKILLFEWREGEYHYELIPYWYHKGFESFLGYTIKCGLFGFLYFIEKKTLFIRKIVTKNKYFSNEYLF